jgi:hypothetical protein
MVFDIYSTLSMFTVFLAHKLETSLEDVGLQVKQILLF